MKGTSPASWIWPSELNPNQWNRKWSFVTKAPPSWFWFYPTFPTFNILQLYHILEHSHELNTAAALPLSSATFHHQGNVAWGLVSFHSNQKLTSPFSKFSYAILCTSLPLSRFYSILRWVICVHQVYSLRQEFYHTIFVSPTRPNTHFHKDLPIH